MSFHPGEEVTFQYTIGSLLNAPLLGTVFREMGA